jgi:HlyD family secretion protein
MRTVRRLELAGYGAIALLFGGAGVWASTAHIAGAVIAPGSVVVRSSVKKVQHPTGGVDAELDVHDGDHVKAGQIVIRLDDTVARATVGVVQVQLDELQARLARLMAERDGADHIEFPQVLLARASASCSNRAGSPRPASVRSFRSVSPNRTRKYAASKHSRMRRSRKSPSSTLS